MNDEATGSILRGVRAMIGLAEVGGPVSLGFFANALGLPPSTAHRILSVLRRAGYAAQDAKTGNYIPGRAFLGAATLFGARGVFERSVRDQLLKLVDVSGETAFHGTYIATTRRIRFKAQIFSEHGVQYFPRNDKDYSVLWGASGRSIAAFLPKTTLKTIYDLEADTEEGHAKLPSWPDFLTEMSAIRALGYCTTSNQRFEGAHSIAAPIMGANDAAVGSIGVSMPSARRVEANIASLAGLVTEAARQLSHVVQCRIQPELDDRPLDVP